MKEYVLMNTKTKLYDQGLISFADLHSCGALGKQAAMQGSYSIKYVLPALFPNDPELNYQSLEGVHNGREASDTFQMMRSMEKPKREEYRRHLLKYCELDTYAMVKVLQKLYEATEEKG